MRRNFLSLFLSTLIAVPLHASELQLDGLQDFQATKAENWGEAGELDGSASSEERIVGTSGKGVLIANPSKSNRSNLLSLQLHGDVRLSLEFWLPPGSNSGIYLQGRYEIQLFDSWGRKDLTYADCGGIYSRWNAKRGSGRERYEGIAPGANACRPPGNWQRLEIAFRAPRFDPGGRKIESARFLAVILNGVLVQEDAEVTGPTRAASFDDEQPLGPLMLQGDHGPVAFRKIVLQETSFP